MQEDSAAAFAQAQALDMFSRIASAAFRSGARGVTWDNILMAHPWGCSLQGIALPVLHWQGEADRVVPLSQGQYVAGSIPDCESKFYPNEGHISSITNHYQEMLGAIIC